VADPKVPGIYAIRNLTNGKCYVGSAIRLARRWAVHRHTLKTGTHRCQPLQRAWNKHGKDAFVFEVLEVVNDLISLITREQYWLDTLQSHCESNGYNVCPTAQSRLGMKMPQSAKDRIGAASRGRKLTEEQKAAISLVHKGKTTSAAHRAAVSAAVKGRPQSPELIAKRAAANRGRKMSDEQKAIVSKVHKGKTIAQYHKDAVSKATTARWVTFRAARFITPPAWKR
jgi:group I intron endonuclease